MLVELASAREPETAFLSRGFLPLLLVTAGLLTFPINAEAWDSATHRLIVRLAIEALPPSPLKDVLLRNQSTVDIRGTDWY